MATQNSTPAGKAPCSPPFQLRVTFEGCFVFALSVAADGDTIDGITVYAPDCGHIYSGGIQGQWNNPFLKPTGPDDSSLLFMLEPRHYCLELGTQMTGAMSLNTLMGEIGDLNIWADGQRPIGQGQGWNMQVKLPVPDGGWSTDSMSVGEAFAGDAAENFTNIGMSQTLIYNDVSSFRLRGSPLPLCYTVQTDSSTGELYVPFTISTEPPCIPSIEHQRMAVQVMAEMVGLDLTLQNPLVSGGMNHGSTSGNHILPMATRTGACMGGIIGVAG
jgi:hypothetical protein